MHARAGLFVRVPKCWRAHACTHTADIYTHIHTQAHTQHTYTHTQMVMAYVVRQHTDAMASAEAATEDGSEGVEEEDGVQVCVCICTCISIVCVCAG